MPDRWVRDWLGQLPDAPPPGSTFDTERLWAQLRPELQADPARRLAGWAWYVVAACLSGLILGWFLLNQPADNHKAYIAHNTVKKANPPFLTGRTPYVATKLTRSEPARSVAVRRILSLRRERNDSETPKYNVIVPAPEQTEFVVQLPELPAETAMPPIAEKLVQSQKPAIAQTRPKHRFQVVHQNELRAEEEARPKLYRTEHFVRIGTVQPDSPTPEERQPAPVMSLTNKPNR